MRLNEFRLVGFEFSASERFDSHHRADKSNYTPEYCSLSMEAQVLINELENAE